jgi:hypothetical protein
MLLPCAWERGDAKLVVRAAVSPPMEAAGKTSCFSRPDPQARVPTLQFGARLPRSGPTPIMRFTGVRACA